MPHDVYDFAADLLPSLNLKKRKATEREGERESRVAMTVSLLAYQIQILYTSKAMIAKGYRMAFVMLESNHYRVKPIACTT